MRDLWRGRPNLRSASLVVACVAVVATAGACSSSGGGGSASGAYKLGLVVDETGPLGYQGVPLTSGFKSYVKYVNAHGGVDGHKIDVSTYDSKGVPTTSVTETSTAILQDHVIGLFGYLNSAETVAINPTLKTNKVAAFATLSKTTLDNPEEFGADTPIAYVPNAQFGVAKALMSHAKITAPRVALMPCVTPVCADWAKSVTGLVHAAGWKVVANQAVPLGATDLSGPNSTIARAKPDIVIMEGPGNQAVLGVGGLRKDGFNGPVVEGYPGATPSIFDRLKDSGYYAVSSRKIIGADTNAGVTSEVANIKANGGNPNLQYIDSGYAGAIIMAAALKKCGWPCSASKYLSSVTNLGAVDMRGIGIGTVSYTAKYHAGYEDVQAYHWDPTAKAARPALGVYSVKPGS